MFEIPLAAKASSPVQAGGRDAARCVGTPSVALSTSQKYPATGYPHGSEHSEARSQRIEHYPASKTLTRLSPGYRLVGEGPGGGVPLQVEAFWDDLVVKSMGLTGFEPVIFAV